MPPVPNTSVDQIFDALHLLAESGGPLGVADVAKEMGIPTSTAHRLLATIDDAGFAARDSTGSKYELGGRSYMLVNSFFHQFEIQRTAAPYVARAAAELGETTALDVRVGWHAVRMLGFEGGNEVHAGTRLGQTAPLGTTAAGLAILAGMPEDDVLRYLRWEGGGRRSAARTRSLRARLEEIRGDGYARAAGTDGEGAEVGIPIAAEGRAIAALSIDGAEPALAALSRAAGFKRVRRLVAELEKAVARDPELARERFAHLDSDEIAALVGPPPA